MNRSIISAILIIFTFYGCIMEQFRTPDTGEESVFVTFNPTNISTSGTETQINKFRMIAFNSGGTLEFNKKQREMDNPSKDLYKLELRPGMYTLYGIGNEPDELLTQLDEVRTSEALDAIKQGDVRSIPENNLPLIWKRTIYIRTSGLDASVGQVSLTNSPDDSGWSSTLPMQMERIAAKISIAARKGNPNEEINMTRVEIKQIPAYTTITPGIYPAGERFYLNTFEWGGPKLITGDADSYTELVKGQIVAENLPATEARKTIIALEYTRNGIAESAVIPFEGNVDRNKLYQYQIKITGIKVEIENITVLPWNEVSTDVTIPGAEISFSQVEVPYSFGQESKVYFTTRNIPNGKIKLEYPRSYQGVNTSSRFTADTKLEYNYNEATETGYGNLTIRRSGRSIDYDSLIVNAAGIKKWIIVRGVDIAGSNIYFDETSKRLTFDDVPRGGRSPHDTYQGLYFLWGGLTAISPSASENAYVETPILWSATGNLKPKTNIAEGAMLSPGKLMLFDPDKGVGDICEYMTRRGIAPSGKKWRAPRSKELYGVATPNIRYLSPFEIRPHNGQGQINEGVHYPPFYFFPSSGNVNQFVNNNKFVVRLNRECPQFSLNERLSYFSGNIRLVSMYNDPDYGEKEYTGHFSVGYPVRCVVDDTPGAVTPLYVVSYDLSENGAGTVTAPTPEGIILNQHADESGSIQLSNIRLNPKERENHTGWDINGKFYPFGATVSNIGHDIVVKPYWEVCAVLIDNLYWATGNLIADNAGGCKIGSLNDDGLYFQFGSLVGWNGKTNLDGTGNNGGFLGLQKVVIQPEDCNYQVSDWINTNKVWTGTAYVPKYAPGTKGTEGVGDPCRYYLGGTWRLPTIEEFDAIFGTNGSLDITQWSALSANWNAITTCASEIYPGTGSGVCYEVAEHKASKLRFRPAGCRNYRTGAYEDPDYGGYWSASNYNGREGYNTALYRHSMRVINRNSFTWGMSVRCVKNK